MPEEKPAENPTKEEGTAAAAWRASLPEEMKGEKFFDNYKGNTWEEVGPAIAKTAWNAEKMLGGSVRIPKEDAKPEELAEFETKVLTRLGRPAKPEEYKYELPYPEFIPWDKEKLAALSIRLHKAGVTNQGFQELLNWHAEDQAAIIKEKKEGFQNAVTGLQTEWGGAFDQNVALAKRVVDMYGGDELKNFFKDNPLGNYPPLIKALAKVGSDLSEGDFLGGPGSDGGLTHDEAKTKINEILNNKEDIYQAKFMGKPGHEERVQEVKKLYEIAYGAI